MVNLETEKYKGFFLTRNKDIIKILLLMLQIFYYGQVFGSTPLILNNKVDNYKLSKNISYFEDKKNNLTFNQILNSSSIQ